METLAENNIKVYGISYDTQANLKKFTEDFDVGYDLLSDVDSEVIKKFGILNTTISPDDPEIDRANGRPYYGLPFPGVYVTDENGVVTEKFFYRHYASRASSGSIMNSALGEILMPKESPRNVLTNDQIKITVVEIRGDKVRLGIEAPREVPIHRSEVYEAIHGLKEAHSGMEDTETGVSSTES